MEGLPNSRGGFVLRGINFKLQNKCNNYLYQIFKDSGVEDLIWNVCASEILYKDHNNILNSLFIENEIINGKDFLNRIQFDNYYIVSADIKAFKTKLDVTSIVTYEDFFNGSCEIALFCTDVVFAELYCKNKPILEKNN